MVSQLVSCTVTLPLLGALDVEVTPLIRESNEGGIPIIFQLCMCYIPRFSAAFWEEVLVQIHNCIGEKYTASLTLSKILFGQLTSLS